jgi:hypothetical protein
MSAFGRLTLVAIFASSVLIVAAPAYADHLELVTSDTATVEPGDIVEIAVVVRSAETQEPVPEATVVATMEAEIVGVSGTVEIARSKTDANGEATLRWQVRLGATEGVVIAYSEEGASSLESQPLPIVTVGSGTQVVRSESGVRIPGFGAWVLISILVLVWALIQFAMLGPVRVAFASARDEQKMAAAGDVPSDGEEGD